MEHFAWIKVVHVATVVISFTLFFVRGVWMLSGSPRLRATWVRVLPHVNDTVLLASAVALAVLLRQYPLTHDWLTAKVMGLLAYIGLGMLALRRGRSPGVRLTAWLAALAVFAYIVAVAVTHDPAPWLRLAP